MQTQELTTAAPSKELFIKMVISGWDTHYARVNKIFDSLTDDQLKAEVAPGKNTGVYLLGHLVAVTDGMLPILGLGEKLYPQLEEPFIKAADKSGYQFPSIDELKQYWKKVNETLSAGINKMEPSDWFSKHTLVSDTDFAKEPHRNKLNIIINRTNHQAYHLGQLVFLQ